MDGEKSVTTRVLDDGERIETTYLSDDGQRLITVTRWLDRQSVRSGEWRSKNRHRNLKPNEVEYFRWLDEKRRGAA
jgi:hypothetical protein